jgi:uncharacterized protein (DUF697 family)
MFIWPESYKPHLLFQRAAVATGVHHSSQEEMIMTDTAVAVAPGTPDEQAQEIIKNYMWWSMGAGLVPYPLFDLAAIAGIQMKMVADLSKVYGVTFSENLGKNIVGSLLGSVAANSLATGAVGGLLVGTLLKVVPLVGQLAGALSVPIFAGAVTFAFGRVFATHFASGGTLLNFDPAKMREHFQSELKAGEVVARELDKKGAK